MDPGSVFEMPPRQVGLDARLTHEQPIKRLMGFRLLDVAKLNDRAETR